METMNEDIKETMETTTTFDKRNNDMSPLPTFTIFPSQNKDYVTLEKQEENVLKDYNPQQCYWNTFQDMSTHPEEAQHNYVRLLQVSPLHDLVRQEEPTLMFQQPMAPYQMPPPMPGFVMPTGSYTLASYPSMPGYRIPSLDQQVYFPAYCPRSQEYPSWPQGGGYMFVPPHTGYPQEDPYNNPTPFSSQNVQRSKRRMPVKKSSYAGCLGLLEQCNVQIKEC